MVSFYPREVQNGMPITLCIIAVSAVVVNNDIKAQKKSYLAKGLVRPISKEYNGLLLSHNSLAYFGTSVSFIYTRIQCLMKSASDHAFLVSSL
jgi:hypothetical protein